MTSPEEKSRAFAWTAFFLFVGNLAYQALMPVVWTAIMQATGLRDVTPLMSAMLFYGFPAILSLAGAMAMGVIAFAAPFWKNGVAVALCLVAPIFAFQMAIATVEFGCSQNWLTDCVD